MEVAVLVGNDLEDERREGLVGGRAAGDRLVAVGGVPALGRRAVRRRRQVGADGVEDGADAEILERCAAEHGDERTGHGRLAKPGPDLLVADRLLGQVLVGEALHDFRDTFDEPVTRLFGGGELLGRDLPGLELTPAGPGVEDEPLHVDQVDHAVELVLGAARQRDEARVGAEHRLDLPEHALVVRTDPVHLVDERDARDAVAVRLAPHRLALGLHTLDTGEDDDGAVEHAQAALDLGGEVDVSRGVDQVDLVLVPQKGRRRGRDRDPPLSLVDAKVHRRFTVVHLADLVGQAGVVQEALRRRRLPRVDVRDDPDVPNFL